MSKESPEVENDIVKGPGQLLAEARMSLNLSVEDVAARLNFKVSLVKNIEEDIYDKNLPDTFNRGYLKNYAKIVNIPNTDVLSLYENLHVIEKKPTRMQSFSNSTTKKAQNSLLMWITYLIIALFIGFTVIWWLQSNDDFALNNESSAIVETQLEPESEIITNNSVIKEVDIVVKTPVETSLNSVEEVPAIFEKTESNEITSNVSFDESELTETKVNTSENDANINIVPQKGITLEVVTTDAIALTKVVFTFSGDCWVNIHDALGERIAWGIKKTGYVMTIDAIAPLKITIGKPELVEIDFGGEKVDMSVFPKGHIAKLTLPLSNQSS